MAKPLIVIVGNCQSSFVANFLRALPEIGQQYEIRRFRNFLVDLDDDVGPGEAAGDLPAFLRANRDRVAAFLRQATHNWVGDPITRADFRPGAVVIEYPVALTSCLWPLVCRDDRFDAMPVAVQRRYPYTLHDSLLRRLAIEGVPEGEVVDAYMAQDIGAMFRLDRLKKLQDTKARQIDAMSTFPISDFVEAESTCHQLFRTMNHPSGRFMAELMRRILDHLPLVTDRAAAAYQLRLAGKGPGIQPFDAPIHPGIAAHFGLAWAAEDRWQFWDEGWYSFRESLLRLYRMQCCLKAAEALRLRRTGDAEGALRMMREITEEVPRSAAYRLLLSEMHMLRGDLAAAVVETREAWAIERSMKAGIRVVRTCMRARQLDEAEAQLAMLEGMFGAAEAELVVLRSNLLLAQARRSDARDLLLAATRGDLAHDYRVWLALASQFTSLRQPKEALAAMEKAYAMSGMVDSIGRKVAALRRSAVAETSVEAV